MKKIFTFCVTALLLNTANAQNIGINNSDPKAALDLNGGFRLRSENTTVTGTSVMLTSNRSHHVLIGSPTADFNIAFIGATENGQHAIITNSTLRKGFLLPVYIQPNTTVELIYSNGAWKLIGTNEPASSTAWGLTGNAGTDTSVNFIGTTDDKPLRFRINNENAGLIDRYKQNTGLGYQTLSVNNGAYNVAIGGGALSFDTSGFENTAIGASSMGFRLNGDFNTAIGMGSLANNSGNDNVVVGAYAMVDDQKGDRNIAVGSSAMERSRQSKGSVAVGYRALYSDTAAVGIIAIGRAALYKNYNNPGNLAIGDSALFNNSSKDLGIHPTWSINNVAIGNKAMYRNATGSSNTAIGVNAMTTNYNGNDNTAIGFESFKNATAASSNNIAIGSRAMSEATEVNSNIAIGMHTLNRTLRSGNIAIGDSSLANYVGFVFDGNIGGNVALGYHALKNVSIGNHNTGIGSYAGEKNFNGIGNVYVGYQAGLNNSQGGANVFLGNQAGYNAYGGNKLYIENTTADSLNSLIYGDFTADSLLLNAKTVVRNNAVVKGYTKLGGYDTDVPSIKMKKISIPAGPAVNAVQSYPLGSGITDAKVVGIQVLMNYAGSWKIPPSYIDAAGYEYNVQVQNNNIVVVLKSGNSANIGGKPISVIVTYEE